MPLLKGAPVCIQKPNKEKDAPAVSFTVAVCFDLLLPGQLPKLP